MRSNKELERFAFSSQGETALAAGEPSHCGSYCTTNVPEIFHYNNVSYSIVAEERALTNPLIFYYDITVTGQV